MTYAIGVLIFIVIASIIFEISYWNSHISSLRIRKANDSYILELKRLVTWEFVAKFDTESEAYEVLKSYISSEIEKCENEVTGVPVFETKSGYGDIVRISKRI
jgi:hypothetical protein